MVPRIADLEMCLHIHPEEAVWLSRRCRVRPVIVRITGRIFYVQNYQKGCA